MALAISLTTQVVTTNAENPIQKVKKSSDDDFISQIVA